MIKYCIFEYAAKAVFCTTTNITATNSLFRYNAIAVCLTGAQTSGSQKSFMWDNLITRNDTGLYNNRAQTGNGHVVNNNITYNYIGIREEFTDGIRTLSGNNINYNMTGYSANGGAHGPMQNNYIGNVAYGAYVVPVTTRKDVGYISVSTFVGSPVAIYIDSALDGKVYSNTIAYNGIGIEENKYFRPASSTSAFLYLAYNCYQYNATYNYRQNCSINRNTQQDYWGTTSTTGIDSTIYDFKDNASLGKLNYTNISTNASTTCMPFTPPPPCYPAPTALLHNNTSTTSATIKWPAVAGAYAYEYYIVPIATTPPSSGTLTFDTSFHATNLMQGSAYRVCVRTRCQSAPFASAWYCDTISTPCDSPAQIHINNVYAFSAGISWDTVAGVVGYEYSVQLHPSLPPASVVFTTFSAAYLSGLAPGQTYDVCVRSKCVNGYSAWVCDTLRTLSLGISSAPHESQPHIYPNPNKGVFAIDIPAGMQAGEAIVMDVNGRVVQSKTYIAGTTLQFDMKDAAKGVYVVRFTTGTTTSHATLVVN